MNKSILAGFVLGVVLVSGCATTMQEEDQAAREAHIDADAAKLVARIRSEQMVEAVIVGAASPKSARMKKYIIGPKTGDEIDTDSLAYREYVSQIEAVLIIDKGYEPVLAYPDAEVWIQISHSGRMHDKIHVLSLRAFDMAKLNREGGRMVPVWNLSVSMIFPNEVSFGEAITFMLASSADHIGENLTQPITVDVPLYDNPRVAQIINAGWHLRELKGGE